MLVHGVLAPRAHLRSRKQVANDVTVDVYLSGVLAWTDARPIEGENHYEHFPTVDWAAGTVTPR